MSSYKGYTLDDLRSKARLKFDWHIDPLQLGAQFVKAESAEDMPRMIVDLPAHEWQKFFTDSAADLRTEVVED